MEQTNTVTLATAVQAALFTKEIQGQVSDGWWENDNTRHSHKLWNAEVVVGENVGCNFNAGSFRYDLTDLFEVDEVVERMLSVAREAGAENYDREALERDLKAMSRAMRKRV